MTRGEALRGFFGAIFDFFRNDVLMSVFRVCFAALEITLLFLVWSGKSWATALCFLLISLRMMGQGARIGFLKAEIRREVFGDELDGPGAGEVEPWDEDRSYFVEDFGEPVVDPADALILRGVQPAGIPYPDPSGDGIMVEPFRDVTMTREMLAGKNQDLPED